MGFDQINKKHGVKIFQTRFLGILDTVNTPDTNWYCIKLLVYYLYVIS